MILSVKSTYGKLMIIAGLFEKIDFQTMILARQREECLGHTLTNDNAFKIFIWKPMAEMLGLGFHILWETRWLSARVSWL